MKKIAILILMTAFALGAQDQSPDPVVPRVFQLKYADPSRLAMMLRTFAGSVNHDDQLKTLTINVRKSALPEIEKIIERFDVPPPPVQNIEVTIYIMSALGQPSAATIPPEMEGVVKQLKSMFSYKGYQLIDTQVIRVRAGQGGEASAVVDNKVTTGPKTISQVKFRTASASIDEKGRSIRIDGLKVGMRIPLPTGKGEYQYIDTGISTDVDVHEGQKVVVGKANMDGSDRASIVVLTARVVE